MTIASLEAVDLSLIPAGVPTYPYAAGQTRFGSPPIGFVCSPFSFDDENTLSLMRHATGNYNSNPVVGGGPGSVIEYPTQKLQLWLSGADDPPQTQSGIIVKGGGALALTDADTNALREGAIPKGGAWYLCQAMGVVFLPGWSYEADGGVRLSARGMYYAARTSRCLMNLTTAEMQYIDTKITNVLGLLAQYPAMSCDVSNGNDGGNGGNVTVGNALAGADIQFSFPWFAGSRCGCDQIKIELELERAARIESDGAAPGGDLIAEELFQQAVRVELYGMNYCLAQIAAAYQASSVALPSQFALAR
jgi:hypothetical protein